MPPERFVFATLRAWLSNRTTNFVGDGRSSIVSRSSSLDIGVERTLAGVFGLRLRQGVMSHAFGEQQRQCEVCDGVLSRGLADWHFVCDGCGTEQSAWKPAINSKNVNVQPIEAVRAAGLAPVREEGYRRLLKTLVEVREKTGGSLLEVGSAHGWFLETARSHFERIVGIEPDDGVRNAPDDTAIEVRAGYFPAEVDATEVFDVVVFNDVFEHIPGCRAVAASVARVLAPRGVAVLSVPSAEGFFYRVSKVLFSLGVRGPFERMWQKDFPSPHLYYFSVRGLRQLFEASGCEFVEKVDMPTIRVRGLWSRITYAESNVAAAAGVYMAAVGVAPILSILPADVTCLYMRKKA